MENLKSLLKNKRILIPLVIFITLVIGIIILATLHQINKKPPRKPGPTVEYDQATQSEINGFTGYTPEDGKTAFVGFDEFYRGSDYNLFQQFKTSIEGLASKDNQEKPTRVSLYKGSKQSVKNPKGGWDINFKIAINNNKKDYYVKIHKETYFRYKIIYYNDEKYENQIYEFNYCDPDVCKN